MVGAMQHKVVRGSGVEEETGEGHRCRYEQGGEAGGSQESSHIVPVQYILNLKGCLRFGRCGML